jgi:hypothetical protein
MRATVGAVIYAAFLVLAKPSREGGDLRFAEPRTRTLKVGDNEVGANRPAGEGFFVMKGGAQTALAIGVGYILGRRRKMRLATMLAVGAATGGAARLGPAAMRQGAKYLSKTDIAGALGPQVTEIVNTVRGELLDAAKGAAAAAVTSRVDSLSDSLHERAETLRNPEAAVGKVAGTAGETVGRAGETAGRAGETAGRAGESVGRLRRRGRDADVEDEAEPERGNGRVRRARSRASEEPEEYEEPAGEYDDDEDLDEAPADEAGELDEDETGEAAPRRRRTTRSPVVRARR